MGKFQKIVSRCDSGLLFGSPIWRNRNGGSEPETAVSTAAPADQSQNGEFISHYVSQVMRLIFLSMLRMVLTSSHYIKQDCLRY